MTRDEILTALDGADLGHHCEAARALLQPALSLRPEPMADAVLPVGASKMGGEPDLPLSTPWPHWKGRYGMLETPRPLHFLAQINFRDATALMPNTPLPDSGLLSVFYDAEEQPCGVDDDASGFRVVYTPADVPLERCVIPDALRTLATMPKSFPSCALRFSLTTPLPPLWCMNLLDTEAMTLGKVMERLVGESSGYGGAHQMLGIADYVQGEVASEFALEALGLKYGDFIAAGKDSPLALQVKTEMAQWLLLLQIDSDRDVGWMWGDAGMLYFHIHERDLIAGDFSRIKMELQCC